MSHRVLDDIVDLRRRLAALDVEMATAKGANLVDLGAIAEMKRRREEMIAFLARHEEAIST